jgi:ribosomal protein L7/L12
MNTPIPEPQMTAIKDALFRGNKIEAIKLYRDITKAELIDSKQAVEKLESDLRTTSPEKFAKPAAAKGCLGMIAGVCALLVAILWWKIGK